MLRKICETVFIKFIGMHKNKYSASKSLEHFRLMNLYGLNCSGVHLEIRKKGFSKNFVPRRFISINSSVSLISVPLSDIIIN